MRNGVTQNQDPWASAFKKLQRRLLLALKLHHARPQTHHLPRLHLKPHQLHSTTPAPPGRTPSCGTCIRDQAYWDKSTTILGQWGSNLTSIIGTDKSLPVGLDGQFFVNAAEIMRWEGNRTETDAS
jgi:hypothetical protein